MNKVSLLFLMLTALGTAGLCAYDIRLDNQTPFEVTMECDLVGKPRNMQTTIKPYSGGHVGTVGWVTRAIYLHVVDKVTGQKHQKFLVVKYPVGCRIGGKKLVLYAEPVMQNGVIDSAFLNLVDLTLGVDLTDSNFAFRSKLPLRVHK